MCCLFYFYSLTLFSALVSFAVIINVLYKYILFTTRLVVTNIKLMVTIQ